MSSLVAMQCLLCRLWQPGSRASAPTGGNIHSDRARGKRYSQPHVIQLCSGRVSYIRASPSNFSMYCSALFCTVHVFYCTCALLESSPQLLGERRAGNTKSPKCRLYTVQFVLYTLHFVLYTLHFIPLLFVLYNLQCTPCTVHYSPYIYHFTLYNYIQQCSMYP